MLATSETKVKNYTGSRIFVPMIVYPNAKINLGLRVLSKRSDGYHELQTVMLPIPLVDILEISQADRFEVYSSGLPIPQDGTPGLVEKAYKLMQKKHDIGPVRFHLRKQIPIGAGLGGGSSDAAFTLKLLNQWFNIGLGVQDLEQMAAQLGSDCAFFVKNVPAFCSGRGEVLEPLEFDGKEIYLALYNPGIHVSTSMAYSLVEPKETPLLSRDLGNQKLWQENYPNDFELPMGERFPEIQQAIETLKNLGAFYAAMSGSGSSYYGFFEGVNDTLPKAGLMYFGKIQP